MDLHNNPNLGTDLLEVKIKQLEDRIDTLTQSVGAVEDTVQTMTSEITTGALTASSVTTEDLTATGTVNLADVVLGSTLEVGSATITSLTGDSVDVETVEADGINFQEAEGSSLELSANMTCAGAKVQSLATMSPIGTTQYVGYDNEGKLIAVDPTIGVAKWENTARSNTIQPVDGANVTVPSDLSLPDRDTETMTNTEVLAVDDTGKVIKVDLLDLLQKKLTAGYNIIISNDGTISCDIKTMTIKGSVQTYADLPENADTGDVWNVVATNTNYCWNGTTWFVIGSSVDLSDYYTKTEADSTFAAKSDVYTKTQTETAFVNRTFGTCSTSASTQEKTVSIPAITTLNAGCEIKVLFTNGNTYGTCLNTSSNKIGLGETPKLKLNSFTAYPIKIGGEYAGEGFINAGDVHTFVFDGSAWNDMTSDVIYQGSTSAGNYSKKRNGLIEQRGKKSVTTETKNVNVAFQIKFTETPFINTTVCSDYTYTGSTGGPNNNNVVSRIGSINTPNESGFNINIVLPEDRIGYGSVIWIAKGY